MKDFIAMVEEVRAIDKTVIRLLTREPDSLELIDRAAEGLNMCTLCYKGTIAPLARGPLTYACTAGCRWSQVRRRVS